MSGNEAQGQYQPVDETLGDLIPRDPNSGVAYRPIARDLRGVPLPLRVPGDDLLGSFPRVRS